MENSYFNRGRTQFDMPGEYDLYFTFGAQQFTIESDEVDDSHDIVELDNEEYDVDTVNSEYDVDTVYDVNTIKSCKKFQEYVTEQKKKLNRKDYFICNANESRNESGKVPTEEKREYVLKKFTVSLNKLETIRTITIHYTSAGKHVQKQVERSQAGGIILGSGKDCIYLDEFIRIIMRKGANQGQKIEKISIVADNDGAAGQFYKVVEYMRQQKDIQFNNFSMFAAVDFNEKANYDKKGGLFTQLYVSKQEPEQFFVQPFRKEEINGVAFQLYLPPEYDLYFTFGAQKYKSDIFAVNGCKKFFEFVKELKEKLNRKDYFICNANESRNESGKVPTEDIKEYVLEQFRVSLNKHETIRTITIHYNAAGKHVQEEDEKSQAGGIILGEDKDCIYLDELLKLIMKKGTDQGKKISQISIVADNDGAAGQFYKVMEYVRQQDDIQFNNFQMFAAVDFNQQANYDLEEGGLFTQAYVSTQEAEYLFAEPFKEIRDGTDFGTKELTLIHHFKEERLSLIRKCDQFVTFSLYLPLASDIKYITKKERKRNKKDIRDVATDTCFVFNSGNTLKEGQVSLDSFEASKNYIDYIKNFNEKSKNRSYLIKNAGEIGKSPTKNGILRSFEEQLNSCQIVRSITIHYNGHGSVNYQKHLSGQWYCMGNETIKIEDFLKIIKLKSINNNRKKIQEVKIIADCCGASGQFENLLRLVKSNPEYSQNVKVFTFFAASDWDEESFGTDRGGMITEDIISPIKIGSIFTEKRQEKINLAYFTLYLPDMKYRRKVKALDHDHQLQKVYKFFKEPLIEDGKIQVPYCIGKECGKELRYDYQQYHTDGINEGVFERAHFQCKICEKYLCGSCRLCKKSHKYFKVTDELPNLDNDW